MEITFALIKVMPSFEVIVFQLNYLILRPTVSMLLIFEVCFCVCIIVNFAIFILPERFLLLFWFCFQTFCFYLSLTLILFNFIFFRWLLSSKSVFQLLRERFEPLLNEARPTFVGKYTLLGIIHILFFFGNVFYTKSWILQWFQLFFL